MEASWCDTSMDVALILLTVWFSILDNIKIDINQFITGCLWDRSTQLGSSGPISGYFKSWNNGTNFAHLYICYFFSRSTNLKVGEPH